MGKRLEGRGKGEYEKGKEEREEVGCEQGKGTRREGKDITALIEFRLIQK